MQAIRLRRLRKDSASRDLFRETQLHPKNIILPYFVVEGKKKKEAIESMLGIYRLSVDNLIKDVVEAQEKGIEAILLFGIPKSKDEIGFRAYQRNGVVQKAIRAIKKRFKDLVVITDVCLCGYTSHGHCGIVKLQAASRKPQATKRGLKPETWSLEPDYMIDNPATLEVLTKIALSHAEAGADLVAPSAMMDGQVKAIRETLDKNGFKDVGILAYSAKYASNFYEPFREALDSRPRFGDRKSYQMDYRNSDEALRKIKQDINEGADVVMVKPALAYLDIIYRAKKEFSIPIAAYNVSGEYSMIKKLSAGDRTKERDLGLEVLTAIKRAGADLIISYFGKEVGGWLSS